MVPDTAHESPQPGAGLLYIGQARTHEGDQINDQNWFSH